MSRFDLHAKRQYNLDLPEQLFHPDDVQAGQHIAVVGIIQELTPRERVLAALITSRKHLRQPRQTWNDAYRQTVSDGHRSIYPKFNGVVDETNTYGVLLDITGVTDGKEAHHYLGVDPRTLGAPETPQHRFVSFEDMGLAQISDPRLRVRTDYHEEQLRAIGHWRHAATLLLEIADL